MCKIGDIIVIEKYRHGNEILSKHSFIVVDDKNGTIMGFAFDMAAVVMSSFKSEEQRRKKLSYPGNMELLNSDTETVPDNGKDGFIKADQLYLFRRENIDFTVIGTINEEKLEALLDFMESGKFEVTTITDNL